MPKFLAYELFEVTAKDAVEAAEKAASRKGSVVVVAASLRELAHPVHLAEAERSFGSVGMKEDG